MDGGTVWNTNLVSAVHRCREQVSDDSQITLDIVMADSKEQGPWNEKTSNAISNLMRYNSIKNYHDGRSDILEFKEAFPKVNFRYFVEPTGPLANGFDILHVDNKTVTWPMQLQGRKDGARVVEAGEGYMFERMDEWSNSSDLKQDFPNLSDYLTSLYRNFTGQKQQQTEKEIIQ